MSTVRTRKTIPAPLDRTWAAISDLAAVEDWHPNVAHAEVLTPESSGIGAVRRVEFHDGNSVVETVVRESAGEYSTMEMTESPMMRSAYVTISVEEAGDGTAVTFEIDYEMSYGPIGWLVDRAMMRRMFPSVFSSALDGLSYHLATGEKVDQEVPTPTT